MPFEWTAEHDQLILDNQLDDDGVQYQIATSGTRPPALTAIKKRRRFLDSIGKLYDMQKRSAKDIHTIRERRLVVPFAENLVHLLGSLPDRQLAKQLGMDADDILLARIERLVPSHKDTRKSSYNLKKEEEMYQKVREIAIKLPADPYESACQILYPISPHWIRQCLDRFEREK